MDGNESEDILIQSQIDGRDRWPVALFFRDLERMPEIEKQALTYCQQRVLEIGAGAGSHALVLRDLGHEVSCLDSSKGACEVMKKRGLKSVLWQNAFDAIEGEYDTILLLMNGIGLAADLEGYSRLVNHLSKSLSPGGQIIFDSANILEVMPQEAGYPGMVEYRFSYKDQVSIPFFWLYLDEKEAEVRANAEGFSFEIVFRDYEYSYLAVLTKE